MKTSLNEFFVNLIDKYKKFFLTEQEADATKDTATNRLRLVLMHDRTNLSPETMTKMRDELLEVISKYVVVDEEALDLNLAAEGDAIALLASIPIVRAKTKEEQEEAIRELEAKKAEVTEDETSEDETEAEEEKVEEEASESEESAEETETPEDVEEEEILEDEAEEESESTEEDGANIEDAIGKDLKASEEEAKETTKKSKKSSK